MTVASPFGGGKRDSIALYFADARLRYAAALLVLGLIVVELPLGKLLLLLGVIWIAVALILAARRLPDADLDRLVACDLGPLVEQAVRALDRPDDEIQAPPLALLSPLPLAAGIPGQRLLRARTGRDGRLRSPVNRAVVLVPMEDRLGTWCCDLSSITGEIANLAVTEHHYRDIVSLRMEQEMAPAAGAAAVITPSPGRAARYPTQQLTLELTSGGKVAIPFGVACQLGDRESALAPTELEKTLAAIRALLRDKR
jgi:hypothetical protein